ncbi:NADP-dependent oxidoreductase [Kitasatospora sp. DSM 101779]|uniref:NADP-dependent oxidoreductase n=1 Tax=Kitasatospora sp. DSM 101779 TaxID=2853165 RepID=UPI0021DA5D7E|nr:NADP-dependent oxidoreductase [Kitasatospora sp. DSM 101779]MCU7823700.1 NADP-dependent oxidoreductase [Kitasatospora sp. DSM 101779]
MRAVTVRSYGDARQAEITEVPVPVPGPGEVRVRNRALAVHPADTAVRSGLMAGLLGAPPFRLGWDVAGTVDAVGEGVTAFAVGEDVIGLSHWFATRNGTHADHAVLPADQLAPAPADVPAATAAALPLNGLTALQAVERTGLGAGGTLVVTGAGGNLGNLTTQLALARGVRVIAVAGPRDQAELAALGAEFVARGETAVDALRRLAPAGADAVIDTAGLSTPLLAAVRDGGLFVAVRPPAAPAAERGIEVAVHNVRPDGAQLAGLAKLVADGRLVVRVDSVLPLEEVAAAHARLEAGGTRGAVVLTV